MLARDRRGQAREIFKAIGAGNHIDDTSLLDGLASVAGLQFRQFIIPRA